MYFFNYSQICVQRPTLVPKKWPLLTGDRCSEVIYVIKGENRSLKWWSFYTGGRNSYRRGCRQLKFECRFSLF